MIGFIVLSIIGSVQPLSYGELYRVDMNRRDLPLVSLQAGYGIDLTDSFSDLHSVEASAQIRLWKYIGAGILYQHFFPKLSSSGQGLKDTEPLLEIDIPQPLWSVFLEPKLQVLVGDWNFFNIIPIEVDLLLGGGVGIMNERNDIDQDGKFKISWLWTLEQRFRLFSNQGLYLRFLGSRSGAFIGSGLTISF